MTDAYLTDCLILPNKHNLIMGNAISLIFHCLTSLQQEYGILQYVQFILCGLSSVLCCVHSSLLIAKGVDLVVAHGGFLCITKIIFFHGGYLDYRGAF